MWLFHNRDEERNRLLTSGSLRDVAIPQQVHHRQSESMVLDTTCQTPNEELSQGPRDDADIISDDFSDEGVDVEPFISVDEAGKPNSFGPSSALHFPTKRSSSDTYSMKSMSIEHVKDRLVANAALQRQSEHGLAMLTDIDGVPTELALHLLDLHQHHAFLLTYRPAIMRDVPHYGPHCSRFLLNAIFACSSKFSKRIEVRDDSDVPAAVGRRFFRRCDELLAKDSLLIRPS